MLARLIPLAAFALCGCEPAPEPGVVERFTNELERKADAKDAAVTNAADARADARADAAERRIAAKPGAGE